MNVQNVFTARVGYIITWESILENNLLHVMCEVEHTGRKLASLDTWRLMVGMERTNVIFVRWHSREQKTLLITIKEYTLVRIPFRNAMKKWKLLIDYLNWINRLLYYCLGSRSRGNYVINHNICFYFFILRSHINVCYQYILNICM